LFDCYCVYSAVLTEGNLSGVKICNFIYSILNLLLLQFFIQLNLPVFWVILEQKKLHVFNILLVFFISHTTGKYKCFFLLVQAKEVEKI
jgi:hypothetical protein